jgi:glycosyltransferase involved in cell wall biosynthesis
VLVPRGDAEALAGAIGRYVADPALRRAHGAAARARTVRRYDRDRLTEALLALYGELGAGRAAAGRVGAR